MNVVISCDSQSGETRPILAEPFKGCPNYDPIACYQEPPVCSFTCGIFQTGVFEH